jgi:serine phosphatase RsbU (regulator of sigma subunit)
VWFCYLFYLPAGAHPPPAAGPLGGDFFAFRSRSPERLALVIGDACGRGEDGAHLLPSVLARVECLAAGSGRPSHFLDYLNRGLVDELPRDRFVTASAIELDARAGTLTIANAGHVPVVLRRASGQVKIVGRASGPPLGILHASSYFDETYSLGVGDMVVLMTDGVVEALETDLTEMPTLMSLVRQTLGSGDALHRRVLHELQEKQKRREPDDMTLLSLELVTSCAHARHYETRAAV